MKKYWGIYWNSDLTRWGKMIVYANSFAEAQEKSAKQGLKMCMITPMEVR